MRVLVAPDKFAGTLSSAEAAAAIAEGWQRHAPDDVVTCVPVADGGPGFAGVLAEALGGRFEAVVVRGPLGTPVPIELVEAAGTVYLESSQACGHGLEPTVEPMRASSVGVGEAILAATRLRPRRVVVGLGGSVTTDGGAGMLAALGATADVGLDAGPEGLEGVGDVDLSAVREALAGIDLVAAVDVTAPLLGMFGAARTFGPQKGMDDDQIWRADRILDAFVEAVCGSAPHERRVAEEPGAGAAGGLGFALAVLGASLVPGTDVVLDAIGLDAHVAEADLVVTGEGAYDITSRSGKAVFGVAEAAAQRARPCIVLAGRVDVGAREMRAMGVESAYAVADVVGEEAALRDPARHLADLAARVARTWSP
ncbi:glycerate kinase [Aeromicrobium sp. Leaf350]|uniref:glycerate kinase family protein n=1 Tax=Aeromicrobium sp. Leaf350 TaxID=2876565 RepID=UPI001E5BBB65|nr:glycerate kinase [Aeromicrobium sp. Leaf350]